MNTQSANVQRLVLLSVAGSRSYGLHHGASDIDVKGVCFGETAGYAGFRSRFEQLQGAAVADLFAEVCTDSDLRAMADAHGVEGTVYEVRKFFRLAAECNPNILESLFCSEQHVLHCSPVGERLREHARAFLSGKAKHTFCGYAMAQLARTKTHRKWLLNPPLAPPTQADFGLPEKRLIPMSHQQELAALVQKQLDAWEPDLNGLAPASRRVVEDGLRRTLEDALGQDPWEGAARLVGLQDDVIEVMQRERTYQNARANWKQLGSV